MPKTKNTDEAKEAAEKIISNSISQMNAENSKNSALMTLGAIAAFNYVARSADAQTIRGLQHIRDTKQFEVFGFQRFDNFLDESPHSPMSYRQFNDRENLLKNEGDQLFDLLNNLKITKKQRKMLGAGNVQLDGETVIVKVNTDGDGNDVFEEIKLEDRARLLEALSAIADEKSDLSSKVLRQKTIIERGEKEVERLRKDLDEAQNKPGKITVFALFLQATNTIDAMAEMVKTADESEKAHKGVYVDALNNAILRLETAYGFTPKPKKNSPANAGDEIADLTSSMSDEELAELMD